ncbi:MAG: hypothetical protein ACFFFH_17515, partial [Candidatus Thorarchaeota archaeon]
SPSEICEQYLELDRDDQPAPFSPKVVAPSKAAQAARKSPEVEDSPSKPHVSSKRFQSQLDRIGYYYRQVPWFTLYRFFSLLGMVLLNFTLLRYNIFYGRVWVSDLYNVWGYDRCLQSTVVAFFAVILEGWVINSWKERLVLKKGFNRKIDDTLVVYTSRFTFLMLFLKTSLLFLPAYLIFTPIWVVFTCIMERQMDSALWQEKLGPWIIGLGSSLTDNGQKQSKEKITRWWTKFRDQFSDPEKLVIAVLIAILGVTFTFPWIALRTGYEEDILHYSNAGLPEAAVVFVILSILTMGGVLVILWYYSSSYELVSFSGKSEFIAWLMRLLAFKTILILDFVFIFSVFYLGSIVILGVLIAFEIVSNTYGGKTFRTWFGNVLVSFGNASPLQRNANTYNTSSKSLIREQQMPVRSDTIAISTQEFVSQPPLGETQPSPTKIEKQVYPYERRPSRLSSIFWGIGTLCKALIMAIWMLFISFYEMFLAFLVVMTSYYYQGMYNIPVFEFKGSWGVLYTGGWTLTRWHSVYLLGIQLFFIVIIQWYSLTTKKPEGIILKVYRNLTRLLLGVVIIGLVAHMGYDVIYNQLQLLIVFGLVFFSEITAWKVRSERKKTLQFPTEQKLPPPNKENMGLKKNHPKPHDT